MSSQQQGKWTVEIRREAPESIGELHRSHTTDTKAAALEIFEKEKADTGFWGPKSGVSGGTLVYPDGRREELRGT